MMNKRNAKKGSALITTVMVVLLVCGLVGAMLSLSLWSKTLAKSQEYEVTRKNELDMLTDLFLKYGIAPAETFGYSIDVFYYEDGTSVMTVRSEKDSPLCTMVVEQLAGDLIARYYDVPYEHTENESRRTIGIHNEVDTNPHLKLTVPKSMVSANGPFYVYGKIKLERAVSLSSDKNRVRAYVNMSMNGGAQTTVMSLTANTNGWVNLHNEDGTPLKFNSVPSKSLDFLIGLDKTSGDLILSNIVIVNSKGVVCYSLANDPYFNGAGDLRATTLSKWTRHGNSNYTTTYPIVTQDPDNYVPKKVLSLSQPNYESHGEPFLALYKSALRDKSGAGYYYITGRFRTSGIIRAELCDKYGDTPTAMFLDVHGYYDHDNDPATPDYYSTYPAGTTTAKDTFFANSGCWSPLLDLTGNYMKFYVPADCERTGEDYIKFTLWGAQGNFDLADIRVYKLSSQNATPNPASDQLVYDMEADGTLGNQTYDGCKLGGETVINGVWSAHWLAYSRNSNYTKIPWTGYAGDFKIYSILNPRSVTHNKATDYDLFQFNNELVGKPYTDPDA